MNYALWIMNYYCPQIYTDFHGFLISQPDRVIMNYALWIMNYYRPQIAQILKIFHFAQTVKHIIPINSQFSVLNCDVAHRFAQILKIYDSFRFKVQGYTLLVEI